MPKIFYSPVGTDINSADKDYLKIYEQNKQDEKLLCELKNKVRQGWGAKYEQRVHDKGKLSPYERIELLSDSKEDILYLMTFANFGQTFGDNEEEKSSPACGVITALVKVHERWVVVVANDNRVASGAWWPKTPEKIIRAQEIALKVKVPIIYLVDCSGLFLPEQRNSFPGKYGAGKIFKMNSLLSDNGVIQIAGVLGDCIAGGGYMPIISDKVFMTEKAYMVIAGAALIQGAKNISLSSHDIGGPSVHVNLSNCANERVPDDRSLLLKIREEIKKTPSPAFNFYKQGEELAAKFKSEEMLGIVPKSPKESFEMREALARIVDGGLFYEHEKDKGQEVICGLGFIKGLSIAIIANNPNLFEHPYDKEKLRPSGILYKEGVAKITRFVKCASNDGIPIIWLQDISGFDVGVEAEKEGLLAYGSSLIYANSVNEHPMMTVLLRRASGAGYYAMAGMPYDPLFQLSTPLARLSVMEGKTLAIGACRTKLDDNFEIETKDELEKEKILQGMKKIEGRIEEDMNPYISAANLDTDEIVSLSELRKYAECFSEVSYQAAGYRRVKNSRIWSLFDELVTK